MKLVLLTESKKLSTDAQDLERQEAITTAAKAAGYYVAGIYREKASGARADRPERHCCKVSDEAAFCLIQRPYISKTLLT
ncbi:hypothetical protein ACXZA7_25120, partial [Escherichia coli]